MKDYFDIGKNEEFITNYDIKDKSIVIHYSKRKNLSIPYTPWNEKKVLQKMEEQARIFIENKDEYSPNLDKFDIQIVSAFLSFIGTILFGINGFYYKPQMVYLQLSILSLAAFIISIIRMHNLYSQDKELIKMESFLEDQNMMNEMIKQNKNVLGGISYKARRYVSRTCENQERIVDINTIDHFTLKDLKTIKLNMERFKNFDLEQRQNVDNKEKGISLGLWPK